MRFGSLSQRRKHSRKKRGCLQADLETIFCKVTLENKRTFVYNEITIQTGSAGLYPKENTYQEEYKDGRVQRTY